MLNRLTYKVASEGPIFFWRSQVGKEKVKVVIAQAKNIVNFLQEIIMEKWCDGV